MSIQDIKIKIDIDSDSKQIVLLKDELKKLGGVFNNTDVYANRFIKTLNLIGSSYLSFQILNNSVGKIVSTGFEANKTFQDLTSSLTSLIQATASNISTTGKLLTVQEKYNLATKQASYSLELLQKSTLNTTLSLEQNTRLYNAMFLGLQKVGASAEDMVYITEKLAIATSSLDFNSVLAGVDGLANGTVLANSDLGRFLKGIGLTNEALKNSSDVIALIKEKLAGFEAVDNYTSKIAKLESSFTELSKSLTKQPFEILESKIPVLSSLLDNMTQKIDKFNKNFDLTTAIDESLKLAITLGGTVIALKSFNMAFTLYSAFTEKATPKFNYMTGAIEKQGRAISLATIKTKGLTLATRLLSSALRTVPFIAVASGIYAITSSLLENSKRAEFAKKIYDGLGDSLKNLTKNQLAYRLELVQSELISKRLELANAKLKVANDGSFKNRAYLDEVNLEFTKLQKASREIKNLIKDIENPPIKKENENLGSLIPDNSQKALENTKKSIDDYKKALKEVQEIGLSPYEKALKNIELKTQDWLKAGVSKNEVLKAQSLLLNELNQKYSYENAKDELNYLEKKATLIDDQYRKEQELASINYQKQNLEINNLDKPLSEKSKLLELETALYNKKLENISLDKNLKELENTSNSYQSLLDSQISLIDSTASWSNNLNGVNANVNNILTATANLGKLNLTNLKAEDKLRTKYEQDKLKAGNNIAKLKQVELQYTKDKGKLEQKNISANLIGYSNLAGAMASMFKEGSREAAIFQSAQTALALVEGTRAVLTAGTGDPYTAIPRMVAMGAMVSTLLSQIGVAFNGASTKESFTYDEFSLKKANDGSGSILGDDKAKSESMKQSLSILEDFAKPQFLVLADMNKSLKSIDNKIGGVAKILFQNETFALGKGFNGFNSGYKNPISKTQQQLGSLAISGIAGGLMPVASIKLMGSALGGLGSALGGKAVSSLTGLGLSGAMTGALASTGIGLATALIDKILLKGTISKVVGKVIGGIFGRKSISQSLYDSGIAFKSQNLNEALNNFQADSYQTIQTTTTKKSWFGKKTSHSFNTEFKNLEDETNRQFGLVLNNLYKTVLKAGKTLGSLEKETKTRLDDFTVDLGKVSLKDKKASEIQEVFSNVFSKLGDDLAKSSFPALSKFQGVGEGMFETLTRVSAGMNEAHYYIKKLGQGFEALKYTQLENTQGNIGFEALYQSIAKLENASYPFNNNLLLILQTLDGGASELYETYITLDSLRDRMLFLQHNIEGLSSAMILGAGDLNILNDSFQAYFSNFLSEQEQLDYSIQSLTKTFKSLNLELPKSKEGFKSLLKNINTENEEGQELYGRVISLSSAYARLEQQKEQQRQKEEQRYQEQKRKAEELRRLSFDTFFKAIDKLRGSLTSLKDTALGFINSFLVKENQTENIVTYNKKRAEFESYFNLNGTLKDTADTDKVKSIYSDLTNLSRSLAQKDETLKKQLLKVYENDINHFDFANDVLKVKIVDGLQDYLNFSSRQANQIKNMFKEGFISLAGLSSLGLNEEQKKAFLSFVNSANFLKIESANYNKKIRLNSYDTGTVDIPHDQLAKVHKNEMIIPKKFSDSIRSGDLSLGDNSKIVEKLKDLIDISIQGFNEVRKFRKENEYNLSILKAAN